MTHWVIEEMSVTRKQYVVESYTKDGAINLYRNIEPVDEEHISDSVFSIHAINVFEYQQTYQNSPQMDWVGSSMILNPR
ncbi:MAG: hypothetical protein QF535_07975 [Anaerolineales bacterium]|jgi:hypothetical protein|nr:hypothetical protein [Anaerolineales bacterium]|tara:strand:+ start:236 stop:472 length:237 start_codon:yes stop_codon:yes gene_type:complete